MKSRGILLIVALAMLCFPCAGALAAEGSFERTLRVTGAVDLDVTTGSGNIEVRTGDAATVKVYGRIQARDGYGISGEEKVRMLESNPPIEQAGNSIRIGHIHDEELRHNLSISYELVVPTETKLHSSTGSGHQTITGIRGPLRANTGSGGLTLSRIGGEVRADSGSGNIEMESVAARAYATAGSGSIRALGIAGGFVASTGSGRVTLEQTAPGDVQVKTGSGSVEVTRLRGGLEASTGSGHIEVKGEPTAEWKLSAGSGSIELSLPSQAAFDLNARSSSGTITVNHPLTVEGAIGRRLVAGKVRGGGVLLDIQTGSGNIRID